MTVLLVWVELTLLIVYVCVPVTVPELVNWVEMIDWIEVEVQEESKGPHASLVLGRSVHVYMYVGHGTQENVSPIHSGSKEKIRLRYDSKWIKLSIQLWSLVLGKRFRLRASVLSPLPVGSTRSRVAGGVGCSKWLYAGLGIPKSARNTSHEKERISLHLKPWCCLGDSI